MIILFRHGRTFEDHEQSYDLGPDDDPRLTCDGIIQACNAHKFIKPYMPDAKTIIHCGPRQRHRAFAWVLHNDLNAMVEIDDKLNEGGTIDLSLYHDGDIIVTSNGPLKKFHDHVDCGNYCALDKDGGILKWNVKPHEVWR